MTKDVLVSISGTQFADIMQNEEPIEIVTNGNYYKKNNKHYVIYDEIIEGENEFVEYVSGATSINDMILRTDALSQVLKYNQNMLKSLQEQIEKNEQLQRDLAKKQVELEDAITNYEKELSSLNSDMSSLVEVSLDINSQIKAQEDLIKYYESIGCKDDQLLSTCDSIGSSAVFARPTTKGYISSGFGYRTYVLNGKKTSDFHPAVDVAGIAQGSPVYATANGTVAAVLKKQSCGGNQLILHVRVGGVAYTLHYAHLLDMYVKVGDTVTQNTVIGTVGGGGSTLKKNGGWDTCSTGTHLHYGMATGFYLKDYTGWSKFVSKSFVPTNMPTYGKWYYSRF